jgi:hypothetical protein
MEDQRSRLIHHWQKEKQQEKSKSRIRRSPRRIIKETSPRRSQPQSDKKAPVVDQPNETVDKRKPVAEDPTKGGGQVRVVHKREADQQEDADPQRHHAEPHHHEEPHQVAVFPGG